MKRVDVVPDKNCLFAAVCEAGNLAVDSDDLRSKTVEYIFGNMSDFYKFMSKKKDSTLLDSMPSISEELNMMKAGGYWVGYESIMALTRHLGAVILVTSGGTPDNDAVRTDSFYFGEERPEKQIHIVWVSAGFYDAAVPTTGAAGSQVFVPRRPVEDNLLPHNGRHPSHVCQCKWACECKIWQKVYTFPVNPVEPSSQAKAAHLISSSATSLPVKSTNPSSSSPELCWDSNKVFSYLRTQAPVLQKWKFIMRWLNLGEDRITAINLDASLPIEEKVTKALLEWRDQNANSATIVALQDALRREHLNSVAGTIAFITTHFDVDNGHPN